MRAQKGGDHARLAEHPILLLPSGQGEQPMSLLERRLVFLGVSLLFLAFLVWTGGGRFPTSHPASATILGPKIVYYGADNSTNGGMAVATGVQPANNRPSNGPWPQYTKNYCFLAAVQALANYQYWKQGAAIGFPQQSSQGPVDDKPGDATSGQILYDMQHAMIPPDGPVPTPTGFTLADIARDFGGDPRAQAYAAWYEAPGQADDYHQYIYHTGVAIGAHGLAKGVAWSHADGSSPEIAIVNHALHSVVIAGVWSFGNPAIFPNADIDSFAVYNPWDQTWGTYLNGAYYARVSYASWTTSDWWWGKTYQSNNGSDPDPVIGIYQAGSGTSNPNAHHWIGYYVSIQRDEDATDDANACLDENGQVMTGP
jgi:hypothetical protein